MYVGVKLANYPHLYYFSHFTHFTLFLRKCEKYQILFNFVLVSKFPISIMETSTLFPRHLEKHKFLLRSIEGVAFLTRDIGNYPCLTEASTADHYSTTHLQYSVVKIFKNLYKLVVRRLQVQEIHPAYELTQLYLLHGPLKYFERSAAIKTLCNYITDHLELLLEHILNTDPDEMWQEKYDESVELFSRMCKALENFVSLKTSTDLCKMQVRLEYMYLNTSPMSSTCIPFKALYFVHYIFDIFNMK